MQGDVEKIITEYGEPVEFTPQGGTSASIMASVQLPVADATINDYDLTSFVIYFRPSDFPVTPPQKFDRVKVRGIVRAIEEVHTETLQGVPLAYIARIRG